MTTPLETPSPPPFRPGRRRRRRDWGRAFARVLCVGLALVGLLPFATTLVVRSAWARTWAATETQRVLRDQGIVATYAPSLHVWPLAVELDRVRVESSDGLGPAIECDRVALRPRIFALLAGKLAIDQVDLDGPRIRAVVRDGKLTNLAVKQGGGSKHEGPIHAPFNSFSVTDGAVDLDLEGVRVAAQSIDLDVTADDDPELGASFETALRIGHARVVRPRTDPGGAVATDDDVLCSVEGRVRVDPGSILVRRFQAIGSADLDAAPDTAPPCDLPANDKRRVEVSLGHLHVVFPATTGGAAGLPAVDGHVHLRAPIALAGRAVALPDTDGWVGVDADVRYADDTILPDFSGSLEAHDVRLDQYAFAHDLWSEITIRGNVIQSPKTTLRFAGGTLVLSETVVDPFAKGARLEHTRLDATGVDFTALMRDLGVHPSSWVGWELREIHAPAISGTFAPLKIDGDFTAKTYSFGVYDRPAEDRARERLFGFSEAQIASHFAVRPEALKFTDVHAILPHSRLDGGLCSIGFHNDLRVDVPRIEADLDDISPIGPVAMRGKLVASAHVDGVFNRPKPVGEITSLAGFSVADVSFGDLSAGHVEVDVAKPEVSITNVRAKRRESPYEVPTAKLRFGGSGGGGFVVDAVATSGGLGLRDVLSMFALDDDPRFDGLDATMATRADVHVALGGPEDACGGGFVSVGAKGHLRNVALYGEQFSQGDADVSLRWYDRERGIAGADVDLRSFVLDKVPPPAGASARASGTVLGSASIRRGGALAANVLMEGVPLSRIDALGSFASGIGGTVSGVARVTGNLDDAAGDAGFVARAGIEVSTVRVRDVALQGSHLDLSMTDRMPPQKHVVGRTRCGAPISAPFDAKAYRGDMSSHGEWTLNGDLFGQTVHLRDVVVTRAKAPHISGHVSLRGVDLGAAIGVATPSKSEGDETVPPPSAPVVGQLWGEVVLDDLPLDAPSKARGRVILGPTFASRGGDKITLRPPRDPIELVNDTLTVPPLEVTLEAGGAGDASFRGGFVLTGGITKATSDPTLAFDARLEPIDLAVLPRLVPKVDGASGKLEGEFKVSGKLAAPTVAGELVMKADDLEVHGLPGSITNVHVDLRASASELAAAGTGEFGGGTISFDGSIPVRGFAVGALDSRIAVRGVHYNRTDGVKALCDADLRATYDPKSQVGGGGAIPRLTGDVTIDSLEYTRPISMSANLASLGTRAKRTEINAYDPTLDALALDLRVRAATPFVIKNDLVEVQLGIDSGTLEVTGTNQRVGLRGGMRALPGGRVHFQTNEFEVRQALIRFDDPTRVAPNVDITAVTEYRRYSDTSSAAGAGAGSSATSTGGSSAASTGATRGGSLWRITLHAYGDADDLKVDMTSEPALSQEDIVLLLTVGMTRAELDQLQASSIGTSIALNALGAASGADRAVKQAIPIIDDFRFGSAYSTVTGKTEPQLTVGKRLTNDLRASVTAGLSEDRELRSNIEWRLNNRLSVQGSYDNINDVSSSALGNIGMDLRWRLEFE